MGFEPLGASDSEVDGLTCDVSMAVCVATQEESMNQRGFERVETMGGMLQATWLLRLTMTVFLLCVMLPSASSGTIG